MSAQLIGFLFVYLFNIYAVGYNPLTLFSSLKCHICLALFTPWPLSPLDRPTFPSNPVLVTVSQGSELTLLSPLCSMNTEIMPAFSTAQYPHPQYNDSTTQQG